MKSNHKMTFRKIATKWLYATAGILLFLIYLCQNYLWSLNSQNNPKNVNYFLTSSQINTKDLLVNTTSCQIVNFSALHPTIVEFIEPYQKRNCERIYGRLTYVNGTNLVVNVTAVGDWGYSMNSVSCCYRTILRQEQTLEKYDADADAISVLSDECVKLTRIVNPLKAEYIKVQCYNTYLHLFHDVIYTNFHTIAQPEKNLAVQNKIKYWKNRRQNRRAQNRKKVEQDHDPPNLVIIGLDSVSRMSAHRNLNKTRDYLKQIGALEMAGYTKVGENTFPNAVPFMTGYSVKDLTKICLFSEWSAQDPCPYIWKRFSAANFLTAYLEDCPVMGNYNYLKTGFVQAPVDYYLRPLMLQMYQEPLYIIPGSYQRYNIPCGGSDRPFEKIGSYLLDLFDMSKRTKTPIFINSWQTSIAHDNLNALMGADDYLEKLLMNLRLNQSDSNTILFMLSDHGYRFGSFRQTHIGWLEDKLPWLSIYLPPRIQKKYPHWWKALEINSRRLLSPFDIYHTWTHILNEFTDVPSVPDHSTKMENVTTQIPRQFGQSLFQTVAEDRTCTQAGISSAYCACHNLVQVSVDHFRVMEAANVAVTYLNKQVPVQCAQFRLDKITAGAMDSDLVEEERQLFANHNHGNGVVIVGFIVQPGSFQFEATVNLLNNTLSVLDDILRTNSINTDVSCVKNSRLERYCYCSS